MGSTISFMIIVLGNGIGDVDTNLHRELIFRTMNIFGWAN